jgi:PD-(D/E)XK nuclease superfamily
LISTFYMCQLQFMLRYIVKLEPLEEVSDELEANRFGTLFHAIMEMVYLEYVGQTITPEIIQSQRLRLDSFLREALKKIAVYDEEVINKNSLLLETIKVLVQKTLDADEKYAPFKILSMEKTYFHTLSLSNKQSLKLQGTIDRVDEKDGLIRIVDYKTGYTTNYDFYYNDEEEVLSKTNKEAFQTLFYSYLYFKSTGHTRIQPVIVPLKKISEGYRIVNEKEGPLQEKNYAAYEEKLAKILTFILDENCPIEQTKEEITCSYCAYKTLCLR